MSKTSYQIATECTIYRLFNFVSDFQIIVSNSILMHQSPSLYLKNPGLRARGLLHAPLMRSKYVLFLLMTVSNIVSECVTIMHAKVSLCQNDICSSNSFQIPSQCTLYCPCFQNVLCSSKSFQIPSECTLSCSRLVSDVPN